MLIVTYGWLVNKITKEGNTPLVEILLTVRPSLVMTCLRIVSAGWRLGSNPSSCMAYQCIIR